MVNSSMVESVYKVSTRHFNKALSEDMWWEIPLELDSSFQITNWRDEGEVGPDTFGQLFYYPERGFLLTMWCQENHPRALYHNPNDPVHTDSCMECFLNIFPDRPEYGYISVEMNANGASHCSFGTGRYTRQFILQRGLPHPEVYTEKFQINGVDYWRASTVIENSLLSELYQRPISIAAGHMMKGNFYKCGDYTRQPHWGSWVPVRKLDFHDPECFGDLIVT